MNLFKLWEGTNPFPGFLYFSTRVLYFLAVIMEEVY